jgi:hypothetical protein
MSSGDPNIGTSDVDVLVPVYNAVSYLDASPSSISAQTFTNLSVFAIEDTGAVAAVAWAGMKSTFDPRPVVSHHRGRELPDLPSLLVAYDRGRGAYFAKYILQRNIRVVYLQRWLREGFTDVYRGSITTLCRELALARNYLVCRGEFGALALSMPLAVGFFVALALKIVLRKVVPAQRSRASVAQRNRN